VPISETPRFWKAVGGACSAVLDLGDKGLRAPHQKIICQRKIHFDLLEGQAEPSTTLQVLKYLSRRDKVNFGGHHTVTFFSHHLSSPNFRGRFQQSAVLRQLLQVCGSRLTRVAVLCISTAVDLRQF
jgi:hypothetical protein